MSVPGRDHNGYRWHNNRRVRSDEGSEADFLQFTHRRAGAWTRSVRYRRGDIHRLLAVLRLSPSTLLAGRPVAASEPDENVPGRKRIESDRGAVDSCLPNFRRVRGSAPGSFLALTLETDTSDDAIAVRRRSSGRQCRHWRCAWCRRRSCDVFRTGWRRARSVLRRRGACRCRPLRHDEHNSVGIRSRKTARRSPVSGRAHRTDGCRRAAHCLTSDAGRD